LTRIVSAEGSFASIRPDESDYFAFDFSGEIGIAATFIGSITNDTLTVSLITNGTLQVGHLLVSPLVTVGTRVVAFDSANGGAGTYTLDTVQNVPSGQIAAAADISSVTWDCSVVPNSRVADPTPQARLLSEPTIARNVTSCLIGTMIDGVAYLLKVTATLSDGRVLVTSADVLCVLTLSPEDDILTVSEFRTYFPAFSNVMMFPDATVAYWINQATTLPIINQARWGQFYNMGIALWVAHVLTLGNAQSKAISGGSSGIGSGVPASKSVNGVSISYDTQFGMETNAGWYGLTTYGNMFLRYLRMAGTGPMQIGTGYGWNYPGTVRNTAGYPWYRPW
jgi:voltage-gated potassium channel Kch